MWSDSRCIVDAEGGTYRRCYSEGGSSPLPSRKKDTLGDYQERLYVEPA